MESAITVRFHEKERKFFPTPKQKGREEGGWGGRQIINLDRACVDFACVYAVPAHRYRCRYLVLWIQVQGHFSMFLVAFFATI